MATTAPVEKDELRQFALAALSNRLHGSRSMPDLPHADVNLCNTHPAPGFAVPTSPPNVPEASETDQIGQPAGAVKTTELLRSTQSSKLSNSNSSLQSSPSAPASDEPAPPTVVPASEGGYYDYLDKVKSLCDEISPGLFDDLFQRHFSKGHGEVFLISKNSTKRILPSSDDPDGIWEYLEIDSFLGYGYISSFEQIAVKQATPKLSILGSLFTSATQEDPHILIVEAIDRTGIQMFGTAFDIDPSFIAQHIGADESRWGQSEMQILSRRFKQFVNPRNRVPCRPEVNIDIMTQDWPWCNMDLGLRTSITQDQARMMDLWPGVGTDRLDQIFWHPRVSCYQASQSVCKTCLVVRCSLTDY
jgi:hypothetical protein